MKYPSAADPGIPGTGREFMERTKYRYIGRSDQQKGLPQPPLEVPADPEKPVVDLPRPVSLDISPVDLRTAIGQRQSIRSYVHEPVTMNELSFLLWCTQGVRRI
jgi:hypothetical protein